MIPELFLRRLLRSAAVAIAIGAALDPAITSNRSGKPDVAVVTVDPARDSALARRVAHALASSFTVTTAPFAGASATVLVGDAVPAVARDLSAPFFAVMPDAATPIVTIETIHAPPWAPLASRVPVTVAVHATNQKGGTITVTLQQDGVVVDRATQAIRDTDVRTSVSLAFTPTAAGAVRLEATAAAAPEAGRDGDSRADAVVDVRDARWSVLSYDLRPSWLATFVRRTLERDNRVNVVSRMVTSRNISTALGKPPVSLDDPATVNMYDAVVVGAPDALTDRDVTGLETFLRQRGGSVVLLLDQHNDGPWQRLADAGNWLDNGNGRLVNVAAAPGVVALKASELAWPARLPAGADALAFSLPPAGDTTARHPVIWRSPIGAGTLIVSGALDAWRYRDSTVSAFDRYWRDLIVDAASAALPPVTVELSQAAAAPGETIDVTVTLRDVTLHPLPVSASVTGAIETVARSERTDIRLWPAGPTGTFQGTIRAPVTAGTYDIVATSGGFRATTPLVVAAGTVHPQIEHRSMLASWVSAHGGSAFTAADVDRLAAAIRAAIVPTPRRQRWHPLRSAWWLLPFALTLSGEWWLRRRRGLA